MSEVLKIDGKEEIQAVAKALSTDTRYKIAKLLKEKEKSIHEVAQEI